MNMLLIIIIIIDSRTQKDIGFVAKKNLPRNLHKEPHPTKLERTQWDPMSNEDLEKDENLFNLDYDLAMKLCRYFSLTFTEFSNFADEVCKYIVLKDVSDFENHYENMEILYGSIFATFLMTSGSFIDILKKILKERPLQNCIYITPCDGLNKHVRHLKAFMHHW